METKEIQYGNITIVVHRPVLTEEESEKRKENIKSVLRQIGRNEERK